MLKPGVSFAECAKTDEDYSKYCPEMIVVPAGKFMMGSPPTEKDRGGDEGPQHEVTIARPFAVSKFKVTFDQWDACIQYGGCLRISIPFGGGRQPAVNMNWDDAQQYVAWLSGLTDGNTTSSARRNGNMPRARELRALIPSKATNQSSAHMLGTPRTRTRRPISLVKKSPTASGSTTFMAVSGNGSRTAITIAMSDLRQMGRHGLKLIAFGVSCAAVPGSAVQSFSARPSAAGTTPSTGTSLSASGSRGRFLRLES
jgi:hypothetical protein